MIVVWRRCLQTHEACSAGFQKKSLGLQIEIALESKPHRITMVQATRVSKGLNLALSPRADRCGRPAGVLREPEMRPVLVVVEQVRRHQPFEMPLIQDDHVVQASRVGTPTQAQQHRWHECSTAPHGDVEIRRFRSNTSVPSAFPARVELVSYRQDWGEDRVWF